MKKEKGITLLVLTITVIVLLILASIATYSGISTIKSSKQNKFKQELEIMQAQVQILYEKYKDKETIDIGKEISGSGREEDANTAFNGAEETETSGYRLFDEEEIKKLGVDGIEREYLLDIMRRKVICLEGFKHEENIYYTLEQLTNKNVINDEIERGDVSFEYTTEELSSGGWKIKVFNIKFSKYVGKGIIQYKDTSTGKVTTVEKNAREGKSYEFTINSEGNYEIIVTDMAEISATKIFFSEIYEKGEIILKDTMPTSISEAKEFGTVFEEKTTLGDSLNNKVTIPSGFKISKDSAITVEDGIVIEDIMAGNSTSNGNQFVWIPVGEYTNKNGKQINNLATREFTSTGATETSITPEDTSSELGEEYTIQYFKNSAEKNGGFYIARYEAGGYCNISLISKPNHQTCSDIFKKEESGFSFNSNTGRAATNLYKNNSTVKSNLINNYAWDTAVNFICQNSSQGYRIAVATDIGTSSKGLTGSNPKDCFSNIYDMVGNSSEGTLEGKFRGGNHRNGSISMSGYMPLEYWIPGKEYQLSDLDHYGYRLLIYLQQ